MAHICLARVDRIGDLILTLPCEWAWKRLRPEDKVEWLVADSLEFVTQSVEPRIEASYITEKKSVFKQFKGAFKLSRTLKQKNFDHVVSFYVPWWVAFAFFLARIPKRTGVASQWFSWIFFNRRLRQKRSQATQHEARYNLDLVSFALVQDRIRDFKPIRLVADKKRVMAQVQELKKAGANLEKILIIHPGMRGSAQNWPAPHYLQLAQRALREGYTIVVTGGRGDRPFIAQTGLLDLPYLISFVEKTSGLDLIALLSVASAVVAPSTGIAHLSASLGIRTIGIYSPVQVQAPTRWAPLGDHVQVVVPNLKCPGEFKCLGPVCPEFNCMEQITVDSVLGCVMNK